jgi:cell wall-associated NlpC family hydrolase
VRGVRVIICVVALAVVFAAVAPAQAAPSRSTAIEIHRVQAGDTLWSVARRYGTKPDRLAALNGISVESILSIGQTLKVPTVADVPRTWKSTAGAVTAAQSPAPQPALQVYLVAAGDTLWSIARRYGTNPDRLAALNDISVDATLRIGQSLQVPAPAEPEPSEPTAAGERATLRPRMATLPSRGAQWASTIVAFSTRYLGVRYRWGGTTPAGFDCSGFMNFVFERTGVDLPRTTYAMFETGVEVPRAQLQAGDIVFFQTVQPGPSHAGIYLGDGRFIHSSSGAGRVTISPMDHRYYAPRYLGARRF